MGYSISIERFNATFFDKSGKFKHNNAKMFKLFPFVTTPSSEPITDLNKIVGGYINRIERK